MPSLMELEYARVMYAIHRRSDHDVRRCAAANCRERWPCVLRLASERLLRGQWCR